MSEKKKPITHVALVLDQSGSMESTRGAAVQGYNEQVQQAKLNSKDQEIFGYLVTFNGEVFEHVWGESAEKLNEANEADYTTGGSTAFRDAIGYTIKKLLATTDNKDENVSYLVIVISDGEENASKHYKRLTSEEIRLGKKDELKKLLEEVQSTNRWTITYMGCDDAYIRKVSEETSIPIANCAKWSNASPAMAIRGMCYNATKVNDYYKSRTAGSTASGTLYSLDANKLADFTEEVLDNSLPPVDSLTGGVWKLPQQPVNLNVTNTAGSATPFSNHAPVTWNQ